MLLLCIADFLKQRSSDSNPLSCPDTLVSNLNLFVSKSRHTDSRDFEMGSCRCWRVGLQVEH